MMQRYEALVLAVPEITNDELKQLESQFDRLVASAKGTTLSFERWGKFKLTYPVRGNEYGVYCLARFEGPASLVQEARDFFAVKFHTLAMRHIIARLTGESLAYQRPKSLEEASTSRDVDTFLKENKMGGLLSAAGTGENVSAAHSSKKFNESTGEDEKAEESQHDDEDMD